MGFRPLHDRVVAKRLDSESKQQAVSYTNTAKKSQWKARLCRLARVRGTITAELRL